MNGVRINYTEMETLSSNIAAKGEAFDTLLANIKRINSELKSCWEGADANKYTGSVDEQAVVMDDLANKIDDIALFLKNVSAAYQKATEENASAIR